MFVNKSKVWGLNLKILMKYFYKLGSKDLCQHEMVNLEFQNKHRLYYNPILELLPGL